MMRCERRSCQRQPRVVIDLVPWKSTGAYHRFCWPCYRDWCRTMRFPVLVNYIDESDKDPSLAWDPMRERDILTSAG